MNDARFLQRALTEFPGVDTMVAVAQTPNLSPLSLDPYGQLIKTLYPRAQSMAVYGVGGVPLWVASGQDDPDLHRLAVDLLAGRPGLPDEIDGATREFDGATAYAFVLRDAQGLTLAVVALLAREGGGSRPLSLVLALLRPALECLQRDLALRASLGAMSRDLSSRDRDLDLLLDASVENVDRPGDADELGRLVQAAVDHLGCTFGTLIIPERQVAIVRTRRDQPRGHEADVVTRTHRHLLTWAQLQRRTMIVNKIATATDKMPPFKILSVPVRHLSHRVIGFLALFNGPDLPDFALRETRLVELLSRKVTSILVNSYDGVTGLLTRAAFEQAVSAILEMRNGAVIDSVIYLDIDRTHVINENFGMHVGDETIVRVAEVIRRRAPIGAICARISGDRFAVFLSLTDTDVAVTAAEGIRTSVAELTQQRPEGLLKVSLSAGVAALPMASKQPLAHALATAEIAAKAAKDHGRDRIETFVGDDTTLVRRTGEERLVGEIRVALATDRFRLFAQPFLPLSVGPAEPRFELLLRMIDDNGELVPPGKFLPAAEHHGLMPEIDRWVVRRALKELALYRSTLAGRVARFAINLSGQSMSDPDAAPFIAAEVEKSGLPADIFCFELSESDAVSQLAHAEGFMQKLRHIGCHFALDHFGTGASSLAYLKTLPVSVIKIDGSFVRDAIANARSESMVKGIAQLARTMGITTVAEFVETDELRIRMANLGVDFGQGFAIGKPLPLEDALQDLSLYQLVASDADFRDQDPLTMGGDLPLRVG
jgi:diguanylate cyclase (GGDEF)-like protein